MLTDELNTIEKYYTVKELTALLGFSRSRLDMLARKGIIKKTKAGRTTLYAGSEIKRYLQECANEPKI